MGRSANQILIEAGSVDFGQVLKILNDFKEHFTRIDGRNE